MTLAELILIVATIIAGEARSVPPARLPVACQVVVDMEHGRNLDNRWYGRLAPNEAEKQIATFALVTSVCEQYPYFRFVGTEDYDLEVWRAKGWVDDDDTIWRWTYKDRTVIAVEERHATRSDGTAVLDGHGLRRGADREWR